jgi:general secretion pathway protein M
MATLASLNPVQSRRLAIAILVAVVAAAAAIVLAPVVIGNRHYNAALDDYSDKLERYARIAGSRAQIAKQLEAIRAKEPKKNFLRGPTVPLAAAETQEAIRGIVERSGGKLITMQPPQTKDEGRYRAVSVNVQITANIIALRAILHAIETNVPFLFVDNLSIRSQVPGNFKPVAGSEPEMFVQMDVTGYVIPVPAQ